MTRLLLAAALFATAAQAGTARFTVGATVVSSTKVSVDVGTLRTAAFGTLKPVVKVDGVEQRAVAGEVRIPAGATLVTLDY